jgi:predicted methyltransferase MtxX (methanogen marker protein 4)
MKVTATKVTVQKVVEEEGGGVQIVLNREEAQVLYEYLRCEGLAASFRFSDPQETIYRLIDAFHSAE